MNRIETITFVYNEEFLLPFFLNHYSRFVDRFNFIYDVDSNDQTLEILQGNSKVNIIHFRFPDKMDDQIKVNKINEVYKGLLDCWVLNVDADEFVFFEGVWSTNHLNLVSLFNVYRHTSESNLEPMEDIKLQRRHGFLEQQYIKPIFVRSGLNISWDVGNHSIHDRICTNGYLTGAHWANADPCFCIDRRIKGRRDRQSRNNLLKGFTTQHHKVTEESIIAECKSHENDPKVW